MQWNGKTYYQNKAVSNVPAVPIEIWNEGETISWMYLDNEEDIAELDFQGCEPSIFEFDEYLNSYGKVVHVYVVVIDFTENGGSFSTSFD